MRKRVRFFTEKGCPLNYGKGEEGRAMGKGVTSNSPIYYEGAQAEPSDFTGAAVFEDDEPMNQMRQLLPVVSILFAGCASTPTDKLVADCPKEKAQIHRRLDEIIDAAEKKDFKRLESYHLYGPKFTKFSTEPPERQDAEAARKGEHDGLSAADDLTMQAEDVKVDVFGDVAVSTFILKYSFKAGTGIIEKKARSTLVFVKDHGEWKITHEHLSVLKPNP